MSYKFQCTGTEGALSGVGKCSPTLLDIKYILLTLKGQEIPKAALEGVSFETGLATLVAQGKVIPLPKVLVKTPATVEPKSKEIAGEMKYYGDPEFRATFTLTEIFGCLQSELRKLNNGNYEATFIDSTGKYLAKQASTSTNVRGFALSQLFFTQINPIVANGETSETDMMITIDPQEFDGELAYGEMGFPSSDLNGIVKTTITFGTVTTSAIEVQVNEACNSNEPVTGLTADYFQLSQGGAVVAISAAAESAVTPGLYTLTATTTANPLSVKVSCTITAFAMLYKSALTTYTHS